jgi:hypothetical protein
MGVKLAKSKFRGGILNEIPQGGSVSALNYLYI